MKLFGALFRLVIFSQGFSIAAPLFRTFDYKTNSSLSESRGLVILGCDWMFAVLLILFSLPAEGFPPRADGCFTVDGSRASIQNR